MKEQSIKQYVTTDGTTFTEGVVENAKAAAEAHQIKLDNDHVIAMFVNYKNAGLEEPLADRSVSRIRNTILEWEQWKAVNMEKPALEAVK